MITLITMANALSVVLLLPAALIAIYYLSLAFLSFLVKYPVFECSSKHHFNFAIVVPAHNEEMAISKTLKSCREINYPSDKYSVFVIADNCTDGTASVASQEGATSLERYNEKQKGKGFALSWAFERILSLEEQYDAVVIIDADCEITPNALQVFNQHLNSGAEVLQANDVSSNPDDSPFSYALSVGNIIENDLFYSPKSYLGLAVFLRGTGMVFKREILEEFPWDASSIAEDKEYSLFLIQNGKKIVFVDDVRVSSIFPIEKNQFDIQRTRWASGNLRLSKTDAVRSIIQGIKKNRPILIDMGITLLVDSKPLVLMQLAIATIVCCLNYWFISDPFSCLLLGFASLIVFAQLVYISLGIFALGLNRNRMFFLVKTPIIVFKLMLISIRGLLGSKNDNWAKMPRIHDE